MNILKMDKYALIVRRKYNKLTDSELPVKKLSKVIDELVSEEYTIFYY